MAKTSKKVVESLSDFLFNKIGKDLSYQSFARDFEIPSYITDNLVETKKLRAYQEEAIKHFIYLYDIKKDINACKHVLFNMATGTGKTLVMASCILFLYEKGYRNFIFLVHRDNIVKQAYSNFIDYTHEKYLFNTKKIVMGGKLIKARKIQNFSESNRDDINMMFLSTQGYFNAVSIRKENSLSLDDFKNNDVVILADEAHSLNVETRKNNKEEKLTQEERDEKNWEKVVMGAIEQEKKIGALNNMLIEFTATVDLANKNIHAKYRDKLIYKYNFFDFNKDGYCKDVRFLYNNETQIENQKKHLIVNAVALSQYRKMLFREKLGKEINPVILVKSKRIKDSTTDREFFENVISNLKPEDFEKLGRAKKDVNDVIKNMFYFIEKHGGLQLFVSSIKNDFANQHCITYNSQKKEDKEDLSRLDNPKNSKRVIFSVNALNEGWDVLCLYDIIHFDISEDKKVSMQDIQLIGRGSRYCPFKLEDNLYSKGSINLFGLRYENIDVPDKRKFDNARKDDLRVLETFFYHFVKTGLFLERLKEELIDGGILDGGTQKVLITMKDNFINSKTYKKGFIFVNKTENRPKLTESDIEEVFSKPLEVSYYQLYGDGLTDKEENQIQAQKRIGNINIVKDFEDNIIKKALLRAENNFFRFKNLSKQVNNIESIDDFIRESLRRYKINYYYEHGKEVNNLDPQEKLQLLVGVILPEVRKHIDNELPAKIGSKQFRPVSVKQIFKDKIKEVYVPSTVHEDENGNLTFTSTNERSKSQTDNLEPSLRLDISKLDWYAHEDNFGTSEEKMFVKFIHEEKINLLKEKYENCEIFLVRNELDFWIFGLSNGKRFSPDYLMFINDIKNKKLYYQCIFEMKGAHLKQKDEWKEKTLTNIKESNISFEIKDSDSAGYREYLKEVNKNEYEEIKNIGFGFYNKEDEKKKANLSKEIDNKLLIIHEKIKRKK
jgi:type III restriction enzyme